MIKPVQQSETVENGTHTKHYETIPAFGACLVGLQPLVWDFQHRG